MSTIIKSLSLAAAFALQVASVPLVPRDLSCPGANGKEWQQGGSSWTIECGTDRFQGDLPAPNGLWAQTIYDCMGQCSVRAGCVLVNYVPSTKLCYLKGSVGYTIENGGVVGARKTSAVPPVVENSQPPPSYEPAPAPYNPPTLPSGGGKRGLCYNDATLTQLFGGPNSKVTWTYDWAQKTGNGYNNGLKYIPMLWDEAGDRAGSWPGNAEAGIAAGADALLGFNEPDHAHQAAMSVPVAVQNWKKSFQPYAGRVTLVSPAVTNGPAPMGFAWLKNFISQCDGCQIDACAVHWYDSATNIQYFKNYVKDAIDACGGKPIWLTEFGATGSEDQIASFLGEVLPWMDSNPGVARYAYFMTAKGGDFLVNNSGGLSRLGQIYNSA
jgi:hypothetical protein